MSSVYFTKRENLARAPLSVCRLAPPLRVARTVQYDHLLWQLPLSSDGIVVRTEPPKNVVIGEEEESGERLWAYRNGTAIAVHEGTVIVYSKEGQLDVVDIQDGELLGVIRCPGALEGGISGDRFIGFLADGQTNTVFSCNLPTRQLQWNREFPSAKGFRGVFAATNEAVFVGLKEGSVIAFRLNDGAELWRSSVADLEWHDPTFGARAGTVEGVLSVFGDVLIARVQHGHVVGLSAADGRRIWTWRHASASLGDGYLYDGHYYLNTGLGSYHVLDPGTGSELQSADLRANLPNKLNHVGPHGPMLVSETHVFVGTFEGYILAFERDSGRYQWSHRPRGGKGMSSYLANGTGRLYYTDMSFRLYYLEAALQKRNGG